MNSVSLIQGAFLFLFVTVSSSQSYIEWVNDFVNCLMNYSHFDKVIFIIEKRIGPYTEQIQEFILQIGKNYPTHLISLNEQTDESWALFLELYVPTFTLIIYPIAVSSKTKAKELSVNIKFAYSLLNLHRDAPNLILLIFRGRSEAPQVIANAFNSIHKFKASRVIRHIKMLEITINRNQSKASILQTRSKGIARLHSHDGLKHTMEYIPEITEIFPKMVKNLNGRRIRLAVQPKLPVLNATANRKGCIVPSSMTGPQSLILHAIAKSSNFTWHYFMDSGGKPRSKYNTSCVIPFSFAVLANGMIDVMANFFTLPFVRNWSPIDANFEGYFKLIQFAYMRHQEPLVGVVPILHAQDVKLSNNFVMLFITTVVMGFVIKIFVRLMKFESRFWGAENIWYVIFGMNVNSHPKSTTERLILSSILIISIVYSMTIMDQLLDIQMNFYSEVRLGSWKELASVKLTLMMTEYDRQLLNETENSLLQSLAEKALLPKKVRKTYILWRNKTYNYTVNMYFTEYIDKICVDNLVLNFHKNVSCIMNSASAERYIQLSRLTSEEETMIVMKEVAAELWLTILLNHEIKYAARFEQVAQYLTEAGLIEKWYKTELVYSREEINALKKISKQKEKNKANIMMQLLFIAFIGYILSFLVFVGELTMLWLRKKVKLPNTLNLRYFKEIKMPLILRFKHLK